MQRIGRAVKADVEGGLAVVDHFADLFLIGDLSDQAASHQFFINTHFLTFLSYTICDVEDFYKRGSKIKTPPVLRQRAISYRGTTSCSPLPHEIRPYRVLTHPIAVTGEPDTSLLTPKYRFSEGCSGMYSHAPPSPLFTSQRFSLQAQKRVTSSLHHGNGIKLPLL